MIASTKSVYDEKNIIEGGLWKSFTWVTTMYVRR